MLNALSDDGKKKTPDNDHLLNAELDCEIPELIPDTFIHDPSVIKIADTEANL